MEEVADLLHLRFSRLPRPEGTIVYGQQTQLIREANY